MGIMVEILKQETSRMTISGKTSANAQSGYAAMIKMRLMIIKNRFERPRNSALHRTCLM
ncbi:hypothetical protein HanRHA438_Chr17g0829401 [Helianthus annuus]|nr:hypothetical protein HanRHA438_Chr17g0829401 [Helianthus annuus]